MPNKTEDILNALKVVKEKLDAGYDKEGIEAIVREQLSLHDATRRSKTVGGVDGGVKFASLEKALEVPNAKSGLKELQNKSDDLYTMAVILGVRPNELKMYNEFQEMAKAMSSTGSGTGDEWVPTGYSAQLYEKVRLEMKVAALFDEIPMPTNPYIPPVLAGDVTAYLAAESTADEIATTATIAPSQVTTSNFTFTAKKIAARVRLSGESDEDSIVPMLPTLKNNIGIAIAAAMETAIINGDTAATHQDSDVTNAKDARKAWNGLRKLCAAGSKMDASTFNIDALRTIRKNMGVYGVDPRKLAWIVSISVFVQLLGLTEVITLDKYGPNATILQGELAKIDGIPIIVSEYVRQDLNATGVYDGTTTTKTELLCAYRNGYLLGNRRGFTLKQGEDIENDQKILVASIREDFEPVFDAATQYAVGEGYNIAS